MRFYNLGNKSFETDFSKLDRDPRGTPYIIVGASDHRIRKVKLAKALGLIVNDTLTWSDHTDHISSKVKRDIGVTKTTSEFLCRNSLLMLYRTLVEIHFRYCNVVWRQCNDTL